MMCKSLFMIIVICVFISGCQTDITKNDVISTNLNTVKTNLQNCNNISNGPVRQACVYRIGTEYGNIVEDSNQCDDLAFDESFSSLARESCILQAAFSLNDSQICENLQMEKSNRFVKASGGKGADVSKELCRLHFLDENSPEFCDMQGLGTNTVQYADCIISMIRRQQDCKLCEKIDVGTMLQHKKDACIKDCAVAVTDLELCKTIWGDSEKSQCVTGIATKTFDSQACNILENGRQDCMNTYFHVLAKNKSDAKICDQITVPLKVKWCKEYVDREY